MRKIGIIGGMSPESTLLYYKYIVEEYRRRFKNHSYPEIIIYSVNFQRFIDWIEDDDLESIKDELLKILYRLRAAGADFALIATNTMHIVYNELSKLSPIPLLSIIDAVGEEISKAGIHVVGLLGTKYTMTRSFYRDGLINYNVKVVTPNEEEIEYINDVIFNELVNGILKDESRRKFIEIINNLVMEGAEGVVLGCTEIPMLISQEDVKVRLFDSTRIHAYKALDLSLSE